MSAGAFSCYQAALQLRPNFPQGLNNLAVIFTAQGRAADALQMLQAAIAAAPDYAEAYNNLGVLQREVGAIKASSLSLPPLPEPPQCITPSCTGFISARVFRLPKDWRPLHQQRSSGGY